MKNLKSVLAITTLILFITSCEKNEPGVAGPQGAQGPQGNANVNSVNVAVNTSDWELYLNPLGGNDWVAQKSVSIITSSVVSSGAVYVYLRKTYSNGGYYYQALPFTWVDTPSSARTYGFSISANTLNIHVEDTDNSLYGLGAYTFKVVAVDGARMSNRLVDFNNYSEVKKTFNLAD